jgi:Icc-related predicted phosphoesterase
MDVVVHCDGLCGEADRQSYCGEPCKLAHNTFVHFAICKAKSARARGGAPTVQLSSDERAKLPTEQAELDKHMSMAPDAAYSLLWKDLVVDSSISASDYPEKAPEGYVRFVCLSDTHSRHAKLPPIPKGDVLLHAGDFTNVGTLDEVRDFTDWLANDASLSSFKHKIVVAGNHDLLLDADNYDDAMHARFHRFQESCSPEEAAKLVRRPEFIYLDDSAVEVYGYTVWGSPWSPWFHDWAFNGDRGEHIGQHWAKCPDNVDVLITHGPPLGYGDRCKPGNRAGCYDLLRQIQRRLRPLLVSVAGHIHEAYGVATDGHTRFINASNCNFRYRPNQAPIVFDLPIRNTKR